MARKAKGGGGGGGAPEWLVTFADLMSLLVCFFVLIISFSTQDQKKLEIVAGSMRDAFGAVTDRKLAGMIEIEGIPSREFMRFITQIPDTANDEVRERIDKQRGDEGSDASDAVTPVNPVEQQRSFMTAATSLRQAMQDMPELTDISKQVMMEITEEGLDIQLVDQDGRSMFAEGSDIPYETTRLLLQRLAPVLRDLPNRLMITGHTAAGTPVRDPAHTTWELSSNRANSVRQILAGEGISNEQLAAVVGKAETEPLFPNDPFLSGNRRISILLMNEAPPLPLLHSP
ncbi:OmpA/MotB family protein [Methylobrevis albus]|uniref:Flagellar motor protein MotB n=1 Tax=Methylobrevis albus TaxID=2793297 RepID=A0A931I3Z8_9HYPH|nr:flagellar motor protein MotB [Methylobrevis albus]MBH0239457.1 flagellar motor protein MotB [Methylobrevis albus]